MANRQEDNKVNTPGGSGNESDKNKDDLCDASPGRRKEQFSDTENKNDTIDIKFSDNEEEYELTRLTPSIEKAIRLSILSISQDSSSDSGDSDENKEKKQKKKRKHDNGLLNESSTVERENLNDKNEDVGLIESSEVREPAEKKLKLDETFHQNSPDHYLEKLTNSQKIKRFLNEQIRRYGCRALQVKLFKPDRQMKILIKKAEENKENIHPENIKFERLEKEQNVNIRKEGNINVKKECMQNIEEGNSDLQEESEQYVDYEFLETSGPPGNIKFEDSEYIRVKDEKSTDDETSSEDMQGRDEKSEDDDSSSKDVKNIKLEKDVKKNSNYRNTKAKSVLRLMSDSEGSDIEMSEVDHQLSRTPKDNVKKSQISYFSNSNSSSDSGSDSSFCINSDSDAEMFDESRRSDDEADLNRKLLMRPTASHSTYGLGEKALETLHQQRELTVERIQDLHGSLVSRPSDTDRAEDPEGLYTPLMLHQQQALAWLLWREEQKPPGGILADDMGLGKTLTMISLVLARHQEAEKRREKEKKHKYRYSKYKGGTLVVCPASLLIQWENEVYDHCHPDTLTVEVYHGINRETSIKKLAQKDIVITTYNILARANQKRQSNLFKIHWDRVILDEAHIIRNHKAQMCVAVCQLVTDKRWALTGTPIHNKQMDLYSLLKFLHCSPFDDVKVWKRWVDNRDQAGYQRLTTLMKTLLLRRTKKELIAKGQIESLPEKFVEEIPIELDPDERLVYEKVMLFSRTIFAEFLDQRAEKKRMFELGTAYYAPSDRSSYSCKGFNKAQKLLLASHADIQTFEILVLLMRLRQICCHPSLIHVMLDQASAKQDGINSMVNFDLINQINTFKIADPNAENENANIDTDVDDDDDEYEEIGISSNRVTENLLTKTNPVFNSDRISSKHRAVLERITEIVKKDPNDKIIIVSQWTAHLNIIAKKLDSIKGATYKMYTGAVAIKNRHHVVNEFNVLGKDPRILLLSLTAGGVGLNLVGANHLMLIDIHWNPQLETQAQDRIYRFGQKKNVFIHRFICTDSIEEKIKKLQDKKLEIAQNVLTGTCQVSAKLSLDDLKSLFSL